jgi:photosystem II stability/assembly factor-like uncharacterized protein
MTTGLPSRTYGRCGLAIYRKNPNIVYAVVQTDRTNISIRGQTGRSNGDVETGGIFRSEDRGKSWKKLNDLCPRPFYYGQIRIDPASDRRIYVLGISFHVSDDGGRTFPTTFGARGVHPDHHALWINPRDPNHLVLGNDGGLYFSKDRGRTWEAVRNLPIGQFYGVAVDMSQPYRVYGGLQDNGSWGGPSATRGDGITLNDWRRVSGGDGFQCQADPTDPNTVYCESQYGGLLRVDPRSGRSRRIRPPLTQGQPPYRFNWNSPLLLSAHAPGTLYYGGNVLFQSRNRGDRWEVISPDLTRGRPGPNLYSGHTITTIAESPLQAGLLYVGTDDGRVHVTRDGGTTWKDLSKNVPNVPADRWITRIECSDFATGTAYLAIDRHRNDDRRPYVFRTTDFGETWTSLAAGLPPDGPVHVIRESSRNRDLLFAGTEFGLFATLDGGRTWQRMRNGLPLGVTVHDLVIHPRDRELVIGTHGRSIYVMDIAPLEELTAKVRAAEAYLCEVRPARAFKPSAAERPAAAKGYRAPNPPYGFVMYYYLKKNASSPVSLVIRDAAGQEVATLSGPGEAGLHRVHWDLATTNGQGLLTVSDGTVTLQTGPDRCTRVLRMEGAAE